MVKKNKKKLPGKLSVFLRKCWGVVLIAAALALYVSIASYNPDDPSFNNQNGHLPTNLLGSFGANLSEGALCAFGLALPLFLIGWLVWGANLLRYGTVIEIKARIIAFITGLVSLSVYLNLLPYKTLGRYWFGGKLFHPAAEFLNTNMEKLHISYGLQILQSVLALISLMALNFVLGITFKDWCKLGICFVKHIWALAKSLFKIGKAAAGFVMSRKSEKVNMRKAEPKFGAELKPAVVPQPKAEQQPQAPRKKQQALKPPADDGYMYPDINLLSRPKDRGGNEISQKELDAIARQLEGVLQEFGVNGNIVRVRPGPVVTLYELEPAPGTKTARVIGLADDIARSMSAVSVRIAVVPGSNTIGIEMPNTKRETVWLKDLLEDSLFKDTKNTLNIVLGKDIGGKNTYADLAKMPHLLVAGTTGSGKSVGVNSMILSLLYRMRPEECKLIMIDPKMLEFSMYNGIPHLLTPVITDPAKAVVGLKWAVREMEERYRKMAQLNVRNISGYNQKLKELKESGERVTRTIQIGFDPESGKPIYEEQEIDTTPLPYIVIVVDEMADLMLVAGKEVEAAIQRLAQMARAAGLHLIMSTQRPSVDVITGTIKANFPSRISFQVTSKIDSRTILGEQGAEQLLGMGDMLYMPAGLRPLRVHGSFVKDSEVEAVVEFLKTQRAPEYVEAVTEGELNSKDNGSVFDNTAMGGGSDEDLYSQAVAIVRNDKKASTSYIQRKLRIGYNRAAALIDRMEEEGIVSAADHVGRREVIG